MRAAISNLSWGLVQAIRRAEKLRNRNWIRHEVALKRNATTGGIALMIRFASVLLFALCVVTPSQVVAQSIQITRPRAYMFGLTDAYIDVNGARVTNLANGGSYKGSVRPGPVTIVVTNWQSPGRSVASFKAAPGKTYRFTVTPRGQSVVAGLALGLIGTALEVDAMFQITPR